MNTKIIISGLVALIAIVALILVTRPSAEAPTLSDPATAERTVIEYTNEGDTARVAVGYRGDTVELNGLSFENEVLERVETASGVRYEKADKSVAFWTKGDEATIYVNNETVFTGIDSSIPAEELASAEAAAAVVETSGVTLTSGSWIWKETTPTGSEVVVPTDPAEFSLTFSVGEQVTGTTDCNNFSGSYSTATGTVSFGALAMTKMFCEDSLESDFVSPFAGDMAYSIDGQELTLTSDEYIVVLTQN
jgi:heat shock protein HslJ